MQAGVKGEYLRRI